MVDYGLRTIRSSRGGGTFTLFYGRQQYLSNFFPSPFTADNQQFECVEQYYQYKKAGTKLVSYIHIKK